MLKFFNILFLILFLSGCGNGETSHADGQPIAPMANDGSYQLALDTSLTKFRLGFPCKYLAVSGNSTGQALAYVDSNWNIPILLYPGYSGLVNAQESLYVDVGPQPGKILQLFYGDEPIISSPAAKVSADPGIALLTQAFEISPIAGSIVIVSSAQNINGVKIINGIMATRSAAVAGTASTVRLTASYPGAPDTFIAALTIQGNSVSNIYQSIDINPIYIAPKVPITFFLDLAGGANGFGTLLLNYQLL